MKLMIIDDHRGIRELIRELAGHFATEVREYPDAEQAINDCLAYRPDMITIDLQMVGMDGLTAAGILSSRAQSAYIVIVSQFDTAVLRAWAAKRGVEHFVSKDQLIQLRDHFEAARNGGGARQPA
jgi:DNA-binding NarL/FixJ family response regulator